MGKSFLVAYFSCSGVTKTVANSIAQVVNADVFEIVPKVPYTEADLNWKDENSRSSVEMKDLSSRPEIQGEVADMSQYDVVFVGFPIWWYVAPRIIETFLESYDFSGKTIVPFCTSGGSGFGKSDELLKKCCSEDAKWKSGILLAQKVSIISLANWIGSLKL